MALPSAQGQGRRAASPGPVDEQVRTPGEGPADLPAWAAPNTTSRAADRRRSSRRSAPPMATKGLGTPDNPDKVPIGGLHWLCGGGLLYGLWTLQRRKGATT